MPYKNVEDRRAAFKRHYEKNKQKFINKSAMQRITLREIVRQAKEVPCADCGNSYPSKAMDFHHSGDKEHVVALMVNGGSKTKLLAEIEKCVVLCAVCHRLRH